MGTKIHDIGLTIGKWYQNLMSRFKTVIFPSMLGISVLLSTFSFALGSKIIAKTQSPPAISIDYPLGYMDLPEIKTISPVKTVTKKPKLQKTKTKRVNGSKSKSN